MYEIDKEAFGKFLAQQRKAKGYTQKALAEKLFVSDKAVSKWERSLSMPDISLLIPLAEILEVSVTELLEGHLINTEEKIDSQQVENLVKRALSLSEETPEKVRARKKKYALLFVGSCLFALLELFVGYWAEGSVIKPYFQNLLLFEGLCFLFGIYGWFFAKERLPTYYDENKISAYSDGFFRMNLVGISFNNSNWPYILKYLRFWCTASIVSMPLFYWLFFATAGYLNLNNLNVLWILEIFLVLYLISLFAPMYYLGRKYQ